MTGNLISAQRGTRAAALLAAGAAAEYFLDRESGRRRRHHARDRSLAVMRHHSREAVRRGKYLEGVAAGLAHRAVHTVPVGKPKEEPDDATLAQKVRSEVLGRGRFHQLDVHVDAHDGVVHLRGEIPSRERIDELIQAVETLDEVHRVESYLHLPGEVAPNKQDAHLAELSPS